MKSNKRRNRSPNAYPAQAARSVDGFVRKLCRRFDPEERPVFVAVVHESRTDGDALVRAIEAAGHDAQWFSPTDWSVSGIATSARAAAEVIAHGWDPSFPLTRGLPRDRYVLEVVSCADLAQRARCAHALAMLQHVFRQGHSGEQHPVGGLRQDREARS
jgi:hypothetical protein